MSLAAAAVHELGHGVVLSHHGRKVNSVGFRLHLGSPAFYVDSVEALLLTRRQRLVQAAAGPWAEWRLVSLAGLLLWVMPDAFWTPVLHRFVVITALTVAMNLLPFAGLDGALLFGDLVGEPHLAVDSREALLRALRSRRDVDCLLVAYAVANAVVSAALLVSALGLWYVLFGGLLASLARDGAVGWTGAATLLGVSFGPSVARAVSYARRFSVVDRLAFLFERRARVRLTERMAAVAPFDRLDDRALGIIAGQLRLHRVGRFTPLYAPDHRGWVVVAGRLGRNDAPFPSGVHPVEGSGLTLVNHRWLARVQAGLLDERSLALVGLGHPRM
jgi:hypothetical protein